MTEAARQWNGGDGALRDAAPTVTAFLDAMRATFGDAEMREAIRQGMRRGTFWAVEGPNGHSYEGATVVGNPWCPWPRGVDLRECVIGAPDASVVKRARR